MTVDDDLALVAQHPVDNPALGALPILDSAPVVEFLDDLDRQLLALIDPFDRIVFARANPQIDVAGAQADESRQLVCGCGLPFRPEWGRQQCCSHCRQQVSARDVDLGSPRHPPLPVERRGALFPLAAADTIPSVWHRRMMEPFARRLNPCR